MPKLTLAALLCLLASPAMAADCDGLSDLRGDNPHPQTYQVAGPGLLTMQPMAIDGCPQGGDACAPVSRQLHPGTVVIVTNTVGDMACASILGEAPNYMLISALLPRSALVTADYSGAVWTGSWRYSIEQQIVIRAAPAGKLAIDGMATWGMFDPLRVSSGGVNQGSIVATVQPKKGRVAFTQDFDQNQLPYDPTSADCSVRMWQLGPYLAVADNNACGGTNVTFTGLYTHGSWAD